MDHREWNIVDARNHFVWQARYLDILPYLGGLQAPQARDVGMQLIDAPAVEGEDLNEDDNEVEEEEEDDPEEDPNWQNEEVPRTPTPPAMAPEYPNQLANQIVWDFDRDLDISDSGRMEPEFDPTVWRDIYSVDECPHEVDAIVLE